MGSGDDGDGVTRDVPLDWAAPGWQRDSQTLLQAELGPPAVTGGGA